MSAIVVVDLRLDLGHGADEIGLRLDDRLRVVVGERHLGLVDLLAVGGDLGDEPGRAAP